MNHTNVMASFINPTVDDELVVLVDYWVRYCKAFSTWFLQQTEDQRLDLLKKACPDMPVENSAGRAQRGEKLTATDILLPELSEDALMSSGGRLCILFMTRRCTDKSLCIPQDIKLLNQLSSAKKLPSFVTSDKVKDLDTPHIDITDPEENVLSLNKDTSEEIRKQVVKGLEEGRLCSLDVFMALKIRRTAIVRFLKTLVLSFEQGVLEGEKPSPGFAQLLQAELALQRSELVGDLSGPQDSAGLETLS